MYVCMPARQLTHSKMDIAKTDNYCLVIFFCSAHDYDRIMNRWNIVENNNDTLSPNV